MENTKSEETFNGHWIGLGALGIILLCVVTIGMDVWKTGQQRISQDDLDATASKTPAGAFAVENFTTCKKAGGAFSSPASDAQCINETVSGAEKLKGSGFSAQVTHELADWLEQSKKLRGQ